MPMTRTSRMEKLQRLSTAYAKTKKMFEGEPLTREFHHGTDIARNWTVITAAYSGLEQTLKYLIAEEKNLTITELLYFSDSRKKSNRSGTGKFPYRTHNLSHLYLHLEEPTREIVQDFYGRFQSLHAYIEIKNVDEFLNLVSGPRGEGYELWRYTLIEDKTLPKNSPEALLGIWNVCIQIAKYRIWENQLVQMPEEELTIKLRIMLENAKWNVSVIRQNKGETFQNITYECRKWLWSKGHPLNSFSDVLWNYARFETHGVENISIWLSDIISRWANMVIAHPDASARTSLRAFKDRAQGNTSDGTSIRWNPDKNIFESIPWTLNRNLLTNLPSQAIMIRDSTIIGIQFQMLWKSARESGYKILENRSFSDSPDQDEIWQCILEVKTKNTKRNKSILSLWQKNDHTFPNFFYLIEECSPEEMNPTIRHWIALAKTPE